MPNPWCQTDSDAPARNGRSPARVAWVDGEYVALENARVSILDRGFLFADSVYEVIPVYAGHPFRLTAHLQRLKASLEGLYLPDPYGAAQWREHIQTLIEANGGGDLAVYVQVTRGASARRDHRLPQAPTPTVVAFCQTRDPADPALWHDGIAAITAEDTRWRYCAIKSTALLANVMAADRAHRAGANEAILVRDGAVLEGTASNVFAVIDGRLVTPALRETILAGITRAAILELAERHAVDCAQVPRLTPDTLRTADEIWITSSTREIYPVTRLDGARVGDGSPGALGRRMRDWLQAATHA